MTGVRLRMDLAYDGAPFHGFARQPDVPTVQGTLERVLGRLLGQAIRVVGAGRTDAGVHADGQVVHLDVDTSVARADRAVRELTALRRRLDRMVGHPITIWHLRRVPEDFHARFSATERGYRYRLADSDALHPLLRFDTWHVGVELKTRPMQQAADHLLGEHDFASFCRRSEGGHTVRQLEAVGVERVRPGRIDVAFRAPAFCHQQVRSVVGCLLEVGRGRREPGWLGEVLAARSRAAASRVAPAHGLTLESVKYGRRFPASPPPVA